MNRFRQLGLLHARLPHPSDVCRDQIKHFPAMSYAASEILRARSRGRARTHARTHAYALPYGMTPLEIAPATLRRLQLSFMPVTN